MIHDEDDAHPNDKRTRLTRVYLAQAEEARQRARHSPDQKTQTLFYRLADLWVKLAARRVVMMLPLAALSGIGHLL